MATSFPVRAEYSMIDQYAIVRMLTGEHEGRLARVDWIRKDRYYVEVPGNDVAGKPIVEHDGWYTADQLAVDTPGWQVQAWRSGKHGEPANADVEAGLRQAAIVADLQRNRVPRSQWPEEANELLRRRKRKAKKRAFGRLSADQLAVRRLRNSAKERERMAKVKA